MRNWIFLSTFIWLFFVSAWISAGGPEGAYQQERTESEPVKVSMVMEKRSIQPGEPFWVALKVALEPGWHTYWKNPGETGIPCSVDWFLPEGFQVKGCQWPVPRRYVDAGISYFGYEGDFTLLVELIAPSNLKPRQDISLGATFRWIGCNSETCLPGDTDVSLVATVLAGAPETNPNVREIFDQARSHVPHNNWKVEAQRLQAGVIELNLISPSEQILDVSRVDFFPDVQGQVHPHRPASLVSAANGVYRLNLAEISQPAQLQGLVVFGQTAVNIHIPVIDLPVVEMGVAPPFEGGLLLALFLAFLGGAILNLMPCVLPVISIKILHLVKMAGSSHRSIFRHGLVFTVGVMVSFWIMAGLLLALQAYGRSVGWGFQLQEPLFVGLLAAVLFVFGLSLFGVFELGTLFASWAGQRESDSKGNAGGGLMGSFLAGVLATAVATPCTGPFLGSAVGFAITLPPSSALAIFSAIGLGMSSPYLLLTYYPSLINWLPRPGMWMVRFKHLMGFIMLATVLWLTWIFGAQTSIPSVVMLLVGFFILAIACWIYGDLSSPIHSQRVRYLSTLCSVLLLFLGGYVIVAATHLTPDPAIVQTVDEDGWHPFSRELLQKARSEGKPVFIDFTAKWCLICQANHYVLEVEKVRSQFSAKGVVKLMADWTRHDPFITEELRKQGRNGVPLYLLYAPHTPQPFVLPQVLTPDVVLKYLNTMHESKL